MLDGDLFETGGKAAWTLFRSLKDMPAAAVTEVQEHVLAMLTGFMAALGLLGGVSQATQLRAPKSVNQGWERALSANVVIGLAQVQLEHVYFFKILSVLPSCPYYRECNIFVCST